METAQHSNYARASYIDELVDRDWQAIAQCAIPTTDPCPPATIRMEEFEIQLRKRMQNCTFPEKGSIWRQALELCLHIVLIGEQGNDERYNDMNVRKLPFVLLEDVLDTLTADQSMLFWNQHVKAAFPHLFCKILWEPTPKVHPCWLPFLKTCNKLIRRVTPSDAASLLVTMSRVFPLSEKSANKAWGSHNADNVTLIEDSDDFEKTAATFTDEGDAFEYSTYESFWKLQHDFNNPNVVKVAPFLSRLDTLFQTFEAQSNSTASNETSPPVKYLTRSSLFSLQIKDPVTRAHILSQYLIVAQHLAAQVPVLGTKLAPYTARAKQLLSQIAPELLELLESILETSEQQWRTWKKNKGDVDLDEPKAELPPSKRRRLLGALGGDDEEEDAAPQFDATQLASITQGMMPPSLDTHLSEYIEALDPEAGIEPEYHPKQSKVFCWRAIRLLAQDYFADFGSIASNGDFEYLVRRVYEDRGVEIPGEAPAPPDNDEDDDDDDVEVIPLPEENGVTHDALIEDEVMAQDEVNDEAPDNSIDEDKLEDSEEPENHGDSQDTSSIPNEDEQHHHQGPEEMEVTAQDHHQNEKDNDDEERDTDDKKKKEKSNGSAEDAPISSEAASPNPPEASFQPPPVSARSQSRTGDEAKSEDRRPVDENRRPIDRRGGVDREYRRDGWRGGNDRPRVGNRDYRPRRYPR